MPCNESIPIDLGITPFPRIEVLCSNNLLSQLRIMHRVQLILVRECGILG